MSLLLNNMAEPFYVGNSRWSNSPDVPEIDKPRALGTVSEPSDAFLYFGICCCLYLIVLHVYDPV